MYAKKHGAKYHGTGRHDYPRIPSSAPFCRYCTEQPSQYFLPRDLKVKSGWHVRLVFHELIVGPLAVGAGQYVGLVLFARNDA